MEKSTQSAKTITPFQKGVFSAVSEVPEGCVTTYAALAARLGCGSARAIGQALKKNPFAPQVPCHRVVRSNGALGGFFGEDTAASNRRKRALLEAEGIVFDSTGRVPERFIRRTLKTDPLPAGTNPLRHRADDSR